MFVGLRIKSVTKLSLSFQYTLNNTLLDHARFCCLCCFRNVGPSKVSYWVTDGSQMGVRHPTSTDFSMGVWCLPALCAFEHSPLMRNILSVSWNPSTQNGTDRLQVYEASTPIAKNNGSTNQNSIILSLWRSKLLKTGFGAKKVGDCFRTRGDYYQKEGTITLYRGLR